MTAETPDASDATRARDADRNIAVELIDAAYSDGQLTAVERERRMERALNAATLGDLRRVTRDLQAPIVKAAAARKRRVVGPVVAVLVAAGIVVGVLAGTGDDEEPPPQQEQEQTAAPSAAPEPTEESDPPKKKPKPLRYSFDVQGVNNFITRYEKEFGTTKGVGFGFDRHNVVIGRRAKSGQIREWKFTDGEFTDNGYRSDTFEPGNIDIAELNVKTAFRKLERIKDRLGLERFPRLGMSVVVASGQHGAWLVAGKKSTSLSECQADWMTLDGAVKQRGTPCTS